MSAAIVHSVCANAPQQDIQLIIDYVFQDDCFLCMRSFLNHSLLDDVGMGIDCEQCHHGIGNWK